MILLAVNWSKCLEKLLVKVNPPIEFLKLPSLVQEQSQFDSALASKKPLLLNGWGVPYRLGMNNIPEQTQLKDWILQSNSPHLGVRLDFQPEDIGNLRPSSALKRAKASSNLLRETSGLDVLLENVAYYAWSERPVFVAEPHFIGETLEATNSKLLFDLAHAKVSAHHLRIPLQKYLEILPLELTQELQLSGASLESDGMRDRHMGLQDEDYAIIDQLLPRMPDLKIISLAYGGNNDIGYKRDGSQIRLNRNNSSELLEQLARLDALRKLRSGVLRTAPKLPMGWHLDKRWRYQDL